MEGSVSTWLDTWSYVLFAVLVFRSEHRRDSVVRHTIDAADREGLPFKQSDSRLDRYRDAGPWHQPKTGAVHSRRNTVTG